MDKLLPCPWCGGVGKRFKGVELSNYDDGESVMCLQCFREVQAKDAIAAWNTLPRQPQWTTYTGEENTMPPILAAIIVEDGEAQFACRHSAEGECYQSEDDKYTLRVGAKWMPWPGGGE